MSSIPQRPSKAGHGMRKELDPWNSQDELQVQEDTVSQKNKPESDWGERLHTSVYMCIYLCTLI